MINKSIAYRLKMFISLAVILFFLVFIFANYLIGRKLLKDSIEYKAISFSSVIKSIIQKNITITQEVTRAISEQIEFYLETDNEKYLVELIMTKYPFIDAIHLQFNPPGIYTDSNFSFIREESSIVESKNSELLIDNNSNIALQIDSLFTDVAEGWIDPYLDKTGDIVSTAFYCPIWLRGTFKKDSVILGYVITELSLADLNESFDRLGSSNSGYAFLINRVGDFITHPDKSRILKENLFSLPAKVLRNQESLISNELSMGRSLVSVIYPQYDNYKKHWAYYTPIVDTGWSLVYIISFKELFAELYKNTFRMLMFALLWITLIYYLIHFITGKTIKPLREVTTKLSSLQNNSDKINNGTLNEVQQVSDTLDYLMKWFDEYRVMKEVNELNSPVRREDLQQAADIQKSLIKLNFPALPDREDIDLHAVYRPAQIVSGDLFDYYIVDENYLVFSIGDVSGSGIPAALFMSVAQTILKNKAPLKKASLIVKGINDELSPGNRHQYFLTLFLGVLNLKDGTLNYCNAAHNYPYILKSDGNLLMLKESHGLPLGLYADKLYIDSNIILESGDSIFLFTDGVTDQQNELNIQFGRDRLENCLKKLHGLPPETVNTELKTIFEKFGKNRAQTDDICFMTIKYKR